MSPNLLDINVKYSDSKNNCTTNGDKLTSADILESKGDQSTVPNDQYNRSISTMEENNYHQHSKLRNNVKAENLKSKIDFLIMSKTGMANAPPAPEEEAEDIQSIQAEINNMLGGKMSPSISRPGMDVKNSTKTKSGGGMDLTKPPPPPPAAMGGNFQSNRHSPLHSNAKPTTTVEKVEHLLESMFSESKPSPVKSMPMDFSSKSTSIMVKKTTTPRQSLEKLSNEAIENILRTPSPVDDDDEMADVKPNIRPSTNSSNNKQPTTKPNNNTNNNSRNNTSSNSNHHSLDINHYESTNNHLHLPPSSLSSSYKLPGNLVSSPNKPPGNVISSPNKPPGNVIFSPNKPRYGSRTRKKSSLSMEDESSNDSTKLEIIDESSSFNNHSASDLMNVSSNDKHIASPTPHSPNIQRSNRSSNRNLLGGGSGVNQDVKSNGEMNITSETSSSHSLMSSSTKPSIENKIKQEPITSSPDSSSATIKPSITPSRNPITPSKNPIMAVENELEKMFAGIVKEEEESPTIKLESLTTKKENNAVIDNAATRKRRTSGERSNRRRSSEFFPSSPEHSTNQSTPPKKKKKRNPAGAAAVKNNSGNKKKSGSSQGQSSSNSRHSIHAKDTSNDSTTLNKANTATSRIAPFIRVYHNKRKDTTVVNSVAKIRDEDSGSVVTGSKKPAGFVPNKKMRSSAQSNLQPANRTDVLDPTWTCVFCKCGPNTYGTAGNPLGDLFGPYRISAPQETYLDGDEFKRRINRMSGTGTSSKLDHNKKKRTVSTDVDTHKLTSGLTRVFPVDKDSSTSSNNTSTSSKTSSVVEYEIWFHEPCIVWGSGCYLVGSSLMGLDQCVWSALNSICVNCGETGASIGCVKSKCRSSVHYSCALHIGWYLDPSTFIATCATHRDKYDAMRYLPHEESQEEGSGSEDL